MANINTNNPAIGLPSIVINPGSDAGTSTPLYPSGWTRVPFSSAVVTIGTNNYPAWDATQLERSTVLFKLKNGVDVVYEQGASHPTFGQSVNAKIYLVDGSNRFLLFEPYFASAFVVMGIVFNPELSDGTISGLAIGFDYTPNNATDLPGDFGSRLLRIDELMNSAIGQTAVSTIHIAQNTTGAQRTYISFPKAFFAPTYYNEDDVDANPEDTDPYSQGGNSGRGGGTGHFSGTGDNISIPSLPTLSAVNTGFITLFNPSISELNNLSNYMWSNPLFDIEAWKKIFADPMDAILGLSIVPVAVPNGGNAPVTVGNISTGVTMNKAGAQYVAVDCGTLNVEEYWGAYLDYDPYTKAEIYLPYIGTHPIAVDDIMGKSVHVVYHVDILSGSCCAFVQCGGSVLYTFVGQCSCSIPITGNDWTNVINGALSIAASIGTMVATGGMNAPMAVADVASTAINSMKPSVEKSNSMGGMGGMLGVQTPYLILTRPRQAVAREQNKFIGYPSNINENLGELSGYTEVESVHLMGIPATDDELDEIERILKTGVIF